jgi:hypothetical protein
MLMEGFGWLKIKYFLSIVLYPVLSLFSFARARFSQNMVILNCCSGC